MEGREVWRHNLELLPPQPPRKSGQSRKKKKQVPVTCDQYLLFTSGSKAAFCNSQTFQSSHAA